MSSCTLISQISQIPKQKVEHTDFIKCRWGENQSHSLNIFIVLNLKQPMSFSMFHLVEVVVEVQGAGHPRGWAQVEDCSHSQQQTHLPQLVG